MVDPAWNRFALGERFRTGGVAPGPGRAAGAPETVIPPLSGSRACPSRGPLRTVGVPVVDRQGSLNRTGDNKPGRA